MPFQPQLEKKDNAKSFSMKFYRNSQWSYTVSKRWNRGGSRSSSTSRINLGVPQGSILGPFLFILYLNDICRCTDAGVQILFADDATHYDSDYDYRVLLDRVNRNLEHISKWLIANKLSINIIKTEAVLHSRRNIYFPLPPVKMNNIEISYNYSLKFLGILLDFKLNWKCHLKHIQTKLSKACGIFYNIRNKINIYIAKIIYYAIVHPYITYCVTAWSSCNVTHRLHLFKTQKRILRTICRTRRDAPSSPLFANLKILKIDDILKVGNACFVFKSINNLIDSPVRFNYQLNGPYNLRRNGIFNLEVPYARSSQSQRFIHIYGSNLWNNIPLDIRTSRTLLAFKNKLEKYYITMY